MSLCYYVVNYGGMVKGNPPESASRLSMCGFSKSVCVGVAEKRQRDGVSLHLSLWMLKLGLGCTIQVAAL